MNLSEKFGSSFSAVAPEAIGKFGPQNTLDGDPSTRFRSPPNSELRISFMRQLTVETIAVRAEEGSSDLLENVRISFRGLDGSLQTSLPKNVETVTGVAFFDVHATVGGVTVTGRDSWMKFTDVSFFGSEPSEEVDGDSSTPDLAKIMSAASGIVGKLRDAAKTVEGRHEKKQKTVKDEKFDEAVKDKVPVSGSKTQGHSGGPAGTWDGRGYKQGIAKTEE